MHRRTFLKMAGAAPAISWAAPSGQTEVSIRGDQFLLNGKPTYAGRSYKGMKIEGLLMNVRAVQAIFDDLNPETRSSGPTPIRASGIPERNVREFVAALPEWRRHGLLAFTVNLQGGSPEGYSKASPGRTRRSIPTATCGRPTWTGSPACSTAPTNWAWWRSSATSTSGRISG